MALKIWIWDILGPLGPQEIVVQRSHPPQKSDFQKSLPSIPGRKIRSESKPFRNSSPPPHTTTKEKNYTWISPSLTWNLNMMVSEMNLLFQGAIFRFHVKFCLSIYLISSQWANNVFPVPGGPANNPPRGTRAPGLTQVHNKTISQRFRYHQRDQWASDTYVKWIYLLLCTF